MEESSRECKERSVHLLPWRWRELIKCFPHSSGLLPAMAVNNKPSSDPEDFLIKAFPVLMTPFRDTDAPMGCCRRLSWPCDSICLQALCCSDKGHGFCYIPVAENSWMTSKLHWRTPKWWGTYLSKLSPWLMSLADWSEHPFSASHWADFCISKLSSSDQAPAYNFLHS